MNNSNFTTDQEKTIALLQFNQDEFFIVETENEVFIFEGNEEEARNEFLADIEGTDEAEIDANFLIYCQNNLTEVESYDENDCNNDYLVLTDEEADEKAKDYILDTVWAFTPSFLSSETEIDIEVFEAIQGNDRCESNNDAILSMIKDKDSFVEEAIRCDGRGHFISHYDGNENEESVNETTYFIYRQN